MVANNLIDLKGWKRNSLFWGGKKYDLFCGFKREDLYRLRNVGDSTQRLPTVHHWAECHPPGSRARRIIHAEAATIGRILFFLSNQSWSQHCTSMRWVTLAVGSIPCQKLPQRYWYPKWCYLLPKPLFLSVYKLLDVFWRWKYDISRRFDRENFSSWHQIGPLTSFRRKKWLKFLLKMNLSIFSWMLTVQNLAKLSGTQNFNCFPQ